MSKVMKSGAIMSKNIRFVDLFAGIGGFAAAFRSLGAECLLAVEKDKTAAETYRVNWGHFALGNVVDSNNPKKSVKVGPHDILAAGFPCQPFSKSGSQDGVLDKSRGTLFNNIMQIIENLDYSSRPTVIVLENVRNLAGPKHKADLEVIKDSLRHLGYTVEQQNFFLSPHKIQREFGGRPQNRERIFILGTKLPAKLAGKPNKKSGFSDSVNSYLHKIKSSVNAESEKFLIDGDPKLYWNLAKDLNSQDVENEAPELKDSEVTAIELWNKWVGDFRTSHASLPSFPIWTSCWDPNVTFPANCPNWKRNFIEKNKRLFEDNEEICKELLNSFEAENVIPTFRKFEWQAGDMDSIWDGVIHFRPSGIRVKKPNYLPALVAITHTPILGYERRRISLREAAYLQGFPSEFRFDPNQEAQHFKQLGNAVNIGAVLVALRSLVSRDEAILKMTANGKRILQAVNESFNSPDEFFATWTPSEVIG